MSDIKSELIEKAMAPAMSAWAIGCGCCAEPAPDEYDRYDEPRGAWLAVLMLSAVADDLRAEGAAALREQLAREIEALPSLSAPGYFATQPSDLIRQDTAARIVRGGEQS